MRSQLLETLSCVYHFPFIVESLKKIKGRYIQKWFTKMVQEGSNSSGQTAIFKASSTLETHNSCRYKLSRVNIPFIGCKGQNCSIQWIMAHQLSHTGISASRHCGSLPVDIVKTTNIQKLQLHWSSGTGNRMLGLQTLGWEIPWRFRDWNSGRAGFEKEYTVP